MQIRNNIKKICQINCSFKCAKIIWSLWCFFFFLIFRMLVKPLNVQLEYWNQIHRIKCTTYPFSLLEQYALSQFCRWYHYIANDIIFFSSCNAIIDYIGGHSFFFPVTFANVLVCTLNFAMVFSVVVNKNKFVQGLSNHYVVAEHKIGALYSITHFDLYLDFFFRLYFIVTYNLYAFAFCLLPRYN